MEAKRTAKTVKSSSPGRGKGGRRRALLVVGGLALLAAIAVAAFVGPLGSGKTSTAFALAPESALPEYFRKAPPNVREAYRFAIANRAILQQIPCYCGCEKSIGHRNLTDCFVRSDGNGWDAHAAGCEVCVDESVAVRRLMADGADAPTIRDSIITVFGPLATPTTTTST